MANFIFNKAKARLVAGSLGFTTSTLRALAVSVSSAGTPDPDDEFLDDILGTTIDEISQTGYSRQTFGNSAVSQDNANDRAEIDYDDLNFGNSVAAGDTVIAVLIYEQIGGDDSTPADDPLVAWIDTDSGGAISKVLGGGNLAFQVNADGLFNLI